MDAKSSLLKSRSSNSAKTLRSEHRSNKKTRSNAEFPPYVMKKRGVYVEPTKLGGNELEKNQAQERPRAPPRPKPGNKKFLASVLTILAKSTTGTQHPDVADSLNKRTERKLRKRTANCETMEAKEVNLPKATKKEVANEKFNAKKKPKYKSRVLNDEVHKEIEQFVVLQSQKEIVHTPSIYSENDSFNWSNLPSLVKRAQQQNQEVTEKKIEEVANELTREIMEGQNSRKYKRVKIEDPKTLVADINPQKTAENVCESNGKLYNFFVDLLEKTISEYNIKAEYNKSPIAPSECSSTKLPLEINESVARKLNEPRETFDTYEATQPSSHFICLKDLEYANMGPNVDIKYGVPLRSPKKKKFKAESFSFLRKPVAKKMKTESVIETKKSFSKKEQKRNLLNLFKEQLRMYDDAFEEPQNLYQALKVIAQNKRRCQKTIHFEETTKRNRDHGFPECMFKRRKVISPSTKGSRKNDVPSVSGRMSEISGYRGKSEYTTDSDEHNSCLTLEVYGYDYETPAMRKMERLKSRQRNVVFTYHSTPTHSQCSLRSGEMLDFSETGSVCFFE